MGYKFMWRTDVSFYDLFYTLFLQFCYRIYLFINLVAGICGEISEGQMKELPVFSFIYFPVSYRKLVKFYVSYDLLW
jgi:hypothetical protein